MLPYNICYAIACSEVTFYSLACEKNRECFTTISVSSLFARLFYSTDYHVAKFVNASLQYPVYYR